MPKEIRYSKTELRKTLHDVVREDKDFYAWGDGSDRDKLVLREEAERQNFKTNDLMERTAKFGEAVIWLAKRIPQNPVNNRLIAQLVGAGTSVGANYCEADDAVSGKDYKKSIGACRKESKESMFFLRMIASAEESLTEEARTVWREAKELNLIFGSIWRK
jgi:four helix bundle protein